MRVQVGDEVPGFKRLTDGGSEVWRKVRVKGHVEAVLVAVQDL